MKPATALLVVTLLVLPLVASADADQPGGSFLDDDGSVHEADIEAIALEGITKGCNPPANFLFCPDGEVTRGQMAAFLVRALDIPPPPHWKFIDSRDHLFQEEIDAIGQAGIAKGCNPPDNFLFCPDDPVTRAQMAAFLHRALPDLEIVDPTAGDFGDVPSSSVFADDIRWLARTGVTKGCNPPANDRFCPDDPVTREQMASFLTRALGLAPLDPPPPPDWPPPLEPLVHGGDTWVVILAYSTDFSDPALDIAVELAAAVGYATGPTDCDEGVEEAVGYAGGDPLYSVSVYLQSEDDATAAAESFAAIGYPGTVALVQTYCLD